MIADEASPLVIDIARAFITLVREVDPKWEKAYLRFVSDDSSAEAKASYVHVDGVEIINVLKHKDFFHSVTKMGQELLTALGKERGLFLLVADSSFNYEIKLEYQDLDKWRISKIGGDTGVPVGFESQT